MNKDFTFMESTCYIVRAFNNLCPSFCVVCVELRPVSLAVVAVNETAYLNVVELFNCYYAFGRLCRICNGSSCDCSCTNLKSLDFAVLVNRNCFSVRCCPCYGLVSCEPRIYSSFESEYRALENSEF